MTTSRDGKAGDARVLHMLTEDAWRESVRRGTVEPTSLASEGFAHCTIGWGELVKTANRHYRDDAHQFLGLTLDMARVAASWRHDDPSGIYPHIYGPIPLDAVVGVGRLPRDAAGVFLAPSEVHVNSLEPLLGRLSTAGARLASTRGVVIDGAPWPVGAIADGGRESAWGPTEVLAHVAEMLQFWLGEMERLVAGPDGRGGGEGAAPFGRTASDQLRVGTIVRDATLPPRELYDRISGAIERYRRRLPELTEDQIARRGVHPTRGELAVPELLERFVVAHLEEHAEQLEASLHA